MYYPVSTYRVQLHSGFTFAHLQELIPYLHRLGVSTIYASPVTRAVRGSNHGYDVVEPHEVNPEIGTLEQLRAIAGQLKVLGMSWLQDIVPNHMAFSADNRRLMDVLERGAYSLYYRYFDINWEHFTEELKGKVLVPVLGSSLRECVIGNELQLRWNERGPGLFYHDSRYPLSLESLHFLFNHIPGMVLPEAAYRAPDLVQWEEARKQWLQQVESNAVVKQQVQERLAAVNSRQDVLQEVIAMQWYLPACWQQADTGMNYRRFFAVNSLISVRMEDELVFNDYHKLIASLYKEGLIQGVRIDHIDGLFQPYEYVQRLRRLLGNDCYIIAEKILEYQEQLPESWPIQGTSGYEFLSYTNQVLTFKEGADTISRFYSTFVPESRFYKQIVYANKLSFLEKYLHGEWDMLSHYISEWKLLPDTYNTDKLKKALGVWMAAFPVYRLYPEGFPLEHASLERVQQSLEFAVMQEPALWEELAEIRTLFEPNANEEQNRHKLQFLRRLMQFTGPLAAKGVEDTTFYVYNPLISHNEVGDSPEQLGITIAAFHDKMLLRKQHSAYSLNATSTHDTKRGEDARMRINVLSEFAEEWVGLVLKWHTVNAGIMTVTGKGVVPATNDEYFIYQSLIGSYPADGMINEAFKQRTEGFIIKALREAKVNTTYNEPDEVYEKSCVSFILNLLSYQPFLDTFLPFLQKVIAVADVYALVQLVVKATAPGIPDIYQGCELWDNSYVDPDNRRPVDYEMRRQLLSQLEEKLTGAQEVLAGWLAARRGSGIEKLYVTKQLLHTRNRWPELFAEGDYIPVSVEGIDHVIAYARNNEQEWALAVLPVHLTAGMPDTLRITLPAGAPAVWRDIFTGFLYSANGGVLELPDWQLLLPVAMLEPAVA